MLLFDSSCSWTHPSLILLLKCICCLSQQYYYTFYGTSSKWAENLYAFPAKRLLKNVLFIIPYFIEGFVYMKIKSMYNIICFMEFGSEFTYLLITSTLLLFRTDFVDIYTYMFPHSAPYYIFQEIISVPVPHYRVLVLVLVSQFDIYVLCVHIYECALCIYNKKPITFERMVCCLAAPKEIGYKLSRLVFISLIKFWEIITSW